ncbi:MAG: neutral/alkaline non-lysosomal ceramidase N-terminal domain-containing protein [Planctomycetota bacterium]
MRKKTVVKSSMLVSVILFTLLAFCCPASADLKGGCARVNITPPLGIPLIGSYGKPSDDVLDELYSKAIVLNDGENTVAIVSSDLLYAPLEEITAPVRRIINEKAGIPEQNILVCATHTHSGPEVFTRSKLGPKAETESPKIDRSYLDTLVQKIASCVLIAHKNMQPVRLGAAKGSIPEIVYNRRPKNNDGLVNMAFTLPPEVRATRRIVTGPDGRTRVTFNLPDEQTEWHFGPIDPQVSVLRIENSDGGIVGSLVNFGCHPVTIYPHLSTSISADYPVHAAGVVEQAEGGLCLFTLGLAGNAVPFDRGVSPCRQIGRALGGEALKRLQFVPTTDQVTVKGLKKKVVFPTKKVESADKTTAESRGDVVTEFQVLRLGDVYILGLPGEVLIEVGLEIKERAGLENLFIITLSNDSIGYVCPAAAYDEGGYEPTGATNLAKGAGEIMVKEALSLLEEIKSSR